jgi:1,4-dihydroxy-2-naphthoate polyprenyltransferase
MATPAQWLEGARPRTLPAAVAPVLAGTGVAAFAGQQVWWKAALALVVALALQVGVNFANDYADGVRGTDADRVGPLRLVGSGAASADAVKAAAFFCFAVACVAGLALAVATTWWLVAVGALAVVAAWFYTGGSRPYGYRGLGEVMVFVFFGLVAVVGTTYVQVAGDTGPAPHDWLPAALFAAVGVGALACAILVANNLRDIPTDRAAGKLTLAVVLGEERSRYAYTLLVGAAAIALVALVLATSAWALLGFGFLLPVLPATRLVLTGTTGRELVPVLQRTGVAELVYAAGAFIGLLIASR